MDYTFLAVSTGGFVGVALFLGAYFIVGFLTALFL